MIPPLPLQTPCWPCLLTLWQLPWRTGQEMNARRVQIPIEYYVVGNMCLLTVAFYIKSDAFWTRYNVPKIVRLPTSHRSIIINKDINTQGIFISGWLYMAVVLKNNFQNSVLLVYICHSPYFKSLIVRHAGTNTKIWLRKSSNSCQICCNIITTLHHAKIKLIQEANLDFFFSLHKVKLMPSQI